MKVLLFSLLVACTACGVEGYGLDLHIWQDPANEHQYHKDDIRDVFYAMMIHLGPIKTERVSVLFHPEPWISDEKAKTWAAGTYTSGVDEIDIWASVRCVSYTSLPHEIVHLWLQYETGDPNGEHDDPVWDRLRTEIAPDVKEWLCE